MKRLLIIPLLLMAVCHLQAQKVTCQYTDQSLSEVLKDIGRQTDRYTINFIYNELEDFRVTTSIHRQTVPDAVRQAVGFYPMRVTVGDSIIVVECTHKTDSHLSGRIIDENHQSVAYANVALLNPQDSTILSGGVSNESGVFVVPMERIPILARISYVGYKTVFKLCNQKNVGTIQLQPDDIRLNDVVVKGERPLVKIKDDAFVTTVEGSYLSKMGTAYDVLSHVPGVLTNGGSIEVLGRGAPLIYINGRQMTDTNELERLGSNQVKDVEVVMTPGAKYDASARSVIRIKTIRPVGEGFSFGNKTMIGTNGYVFGQEEINLNYRTGGLDIFGTADIEDFRRKTTNTSRQDTYPFANVIWPPAVHQKHYMQQNVTRLTPHTNIYYGKVGFNYMFDDRHSLGMTYSAASRPSKQNSDIFTETFMDDMREDCLSGNGHEKVQRTEHIIDAYYSGSVGKWTLDANVGILFQNENNEAVTVEQAQTSEDRTVTMLSEAKNRLYAAKFVAERQLWKGKLELGTEGSSVQRSDFMANPEQTIFGSDTKTDESARAAFTELTQQIGKLSVKLGLRYEHVKSRFSRQILVNDTNRTYRDLFPSAMLSYPLGKVQARLSYARSISRPAFAQLTNNLTYINRYLYESGNPYLRPTYRNSLSLALNWKWLMGMIDYAHVHDYIISAYSSYNEDPNIALLRKDNTDGFNNVQAMLHAAPTFGCYHPQLMLAVMWQDLKVRYLGETKQMNQPMSVARFNNAVNLPYDVWLNVDLSWRSAGDSENIHLSQSWQLDLSLYKSFNNDRLSLKLSCRDVFASMRQKLTIYSDIHQFYLDKRPDSRNVMLTIRYNFNPAKSNYRGQGAGNDVKGRL